ncbi:Hydrolase, NUDIX family [Burkholderiales bacterium]|nr:Hydrolase, NUDIX family [Burkholderiales bacterium]
MLPVPPGLPSDAPSDPLVETTLESQLAYDGVFFQVLRDRVRCADGHVGVREFIHHPGAVMIIAMPDQHTVLLERQFRYALGRSFIEMPAGKLEGGEPPLACAQRELIEETGYRAARWDHLGAFHNAIGYSDEKIEVYLARELDYVGTSTEAGEVLEVFSAPWRSLLEWTRTGIVSDVKTIVGVHWLEHFLAGGAGASDAADAAMGR